MPDRRDEIVLAGRPHRSCGGTTTARTVRVTGIGFVPPGPHNGYADGAWLTPAGYNRIFHGAHFAFKFRAATVSLRPGSDVQAVARRLDAVAAAIPGGQACKFTPPDPLPEIQEIKDLELLPLALSAFLALLAVIGLLLGVPLGIALGRAIWRAVAGFTPLAYHSPLALLTLLLVGPIALLAANVLAAWPQRRAAGVRAAQVLRSE